MLKTVLLSGLAAIVIAVDWLRFEEPRSGGGRPFVLADADDRTPDPRASQVSRNHQDDHQTREHEEVVGAIEVGQVDGAELAP